MEKRSIAIFLVALLCTTGLYGRSITVKDAVAIALENNPSVQMAQLEVERAEQMVREAFGTALPSIAVVGQYSWNVERPVFFFPDLQTGQLRPITVGSEHAFNAQIQLTQTLFNSTAFTAVQNSYLLAKAAKEQYAKTRDEIAAAVVKAFYRTLLAKAAVDVHETSYKAAEEFYRQVSALYREGMVPEYDFLRAEVALESLKPQLEDARQQYRDAISQLNVLLGLPFDTPLELEGDFVVDTAFVLPEEEELLQKVVAANSALQSLRTQEKIAEKTIALYQSEFLPILSLFGNYTYQGQNDVLQFSSFITAKSAAVGLRFSLSLFNGFQSSARVQQAKIQYEQTQRQYEQVEQSLLTQARSLRQRYIIALNRWKVQQKTVQTAARSYEIARIRYREGVATQLEVFDAEASLRQVQLQLLNSIYELIALQADLKALTGELSNTILQE